MVPELPEVESVRRGLAPRVAGRTIESVEVLRDYSIRHHQGGADEFAGLLVGATIGGAARRGKFLWLELERGGESPPTAALLIHLGMSGQLRVFEDEAAPAAGGHVRVRLRLGARPGVASGPGAEGAPGTSNTVLDFVDQRTFGYLSAEQLVPVTDELPAGAGTTLPAIPARAAHIARDLLDPHLDRAALARSIRMRRAPVKSVLLMQNVVSGIGNIYADEALWRARIHGSTAATELSSRKISALLTAAADVMTEALEVGGTSFDSLYVNVNGESGYFARSLHVYGRQGKPCDRCGTSIVRESFMNRGSHFCPRCQRVH